MNQRGVWLHGHIHRPSPVLARLDANAVRSFVSLAFIRVERVSRQHAISPLIFRFSLLNAACRNMLRDGHRDTS